jgi:FMN phosphatase YigB (HAD superfamily)
MTYFIDFDRTLFDTARMYQCAIDEGRVPERFVSIVRTAVHGRADYTAPGWDEFFTLFETGELDIIGDRARTLVFNDATDFLRAHGSESVIVTYGSEIIQNRKIDASGIRDLVSGVMLVGQRPKGEYLKEHTAEDSAAVFVDDSPSQVTSVRTHCPWITVFEMRRDGGSGSGVCAPIQSFHELP